jgi:hypothetical protein
VLTRTARSVPIIKIKLSQNPADFVHLVVASLILVEEELRMIIWNGKISVKIVRIQSSRNRILLNYAAQPNINNKSL